MSAKQTSFIRDLAEYVTRGVLLFEAISIDCRWERATLLSRKVIGSPKHCYEQAYEEKKKRKVSAARKARRDCDRPEVCPILR